MTRIYRALIIIGAAILLSSLAGQPALAIWGLCALVLGFVWRSEYWRAEAVDARREHVGGVE